MKRWNRKGIGFKETGREHIALTKQFRLLGILVALSLAGCSGDGGNNRAQNDPDDSTPDDDQQDQGPSDGNPVFAIEGRWLGVCQDEESTSDSGSISRQNELAFNTASGSGTSTVRVYDGAGCQTLDNDESFILSFDFSIGSAVTTESGLTAREFDLSLLSRETFTGESTSLEGTPDSTSFSLIHIDDSDVLFFGEPVDGEDSTARSVRLDFDRPFQRLP